MVIHSSSPISDSRRRFPHEKTALGADFAASPADRLAEDAESRRDGAFFYQIADGEAILTGCDWDAMQADSLYMFAEPPVSLEIPATLGGYPVTAIGGWLFSSLDVCPVDAPFEVVFPEGLRALDADTFAECFYAVKVTLPATLEVIPEGCFNQIEAEIDFPNGNPRYSCENGFLIDRDTQTLLYAAPSSQGQPIPAVRRLGDSALDNWKPAGNEIRLPDTLELTVTEYDVTYAAQGADGASYLITADGKITEKIDETAARGHIAVTGLQLADPVVGQQLTVARGGRPYEEGRVRRRAELL